MVLPSSAAARRGFTLIEMLIAIAIAALLISVALPYYNDTVRKGRRAEATTALSRLQQSQERWRSNNASYSGSLTDLCPGGCSPTEKGLYTLSASVPAAGADPGPETTYTVTAVAVSSMPQAQDTQCAKLRIRVAGGNIWYGSACGSCSTFDESPHNRCWSK